MCAVILIFAFTMSLVINFAERMISRLNEDDAPEKGTEEAFVTEKQD